MALPSEGAVALVLKPLAAAQRDNDRIYAVVNGMGAAGGAALAGEAGIQAQDSRSTVVQTSLQTALGQAGMQLNEIGLGAVTHSASHFLGAAEASGFESKAFPAFCPSVVSGHAGMAAGLFTVSAAALCLYARKFPGCLPNTSGIPPNSRRRMPDPGWYCRACCLVRLPECRAGWNAPRHPGSPGEKRDITHLHSHPDDPSADSPGIDCHRKCWV